ncbi:MAG: response regulator [Thermogutta sp.]|nr:response regulator [Thermogutta sp.]
MPKGSIMVVDDCEINRDILMELLSGDFEVTAFAGGEECLQHLVAVAPDIVLLDIMMPGIDGYETCRRIKKSPIGEFTQVVLVSGKGSSAERLAGYEAGADDYIVKPFSHDELLAKIRVLLHLRHLMEKLWDANARIQEFNEKLEKLVADRTQEVLETQDITITALARLADSRDPETGDHITRMRHYSRILAAEITAVLPRAGLGSKFADEIYRAAPLHDIGKVGIPDSILLKPGKLTVQEFEVMKRHTIIGYETLREAAGGKLEGCFLNTAAEIARHHHERWDGRGYPDGLKGEAIPLSARIVAVADVFDALTSKRVYKDAIPPEDAARFIEREAGRHFDPLAVEAFRRCWDEQLACYHRHHIGEAAAGAGPELRTAEPAGPSPFPGYPPADQGDWPQPVPLVSAPSI